MKIYQVNNCSENNAELKEYYLGSRSRRTLLKERICSRVLYEAYQQIKRHVTLELLVNRLFLKKVLSLIEQEGISCQLYRCKIRSTGSTCVA